MSGDIMPGLRLKYTLKPFLMDGLLQLGLVALCIPQVLALLARRAALAWIDEANYFIFLLPLLPLLPALVLIEPPKPGDGDFVGRALRRSLWICILFQVGTLHLAALGGMNLLNARYFLSILVPGVVLAATSLSRVRKAEAVAGLLGFAVLTGGSFILTKRITGTFSGNGDEDWRGAVAALSARVRTEQAPLVLFRSGFVEEDVLPLGSPSAATLAPLRSPGHQPFTVQVRSLTNRWSRASRAEYFEHTLAPEVDRSSAFYVLCRRVGREDVSYVEQFGRWVEDQWPGRFQAVRTTYRGVELLEFRLR